MKTPVTINNTSIKAIVDTGAATSAISRRLLKEVGYDINKSSTMICVTVDGTKTASLGKSTIKVEIDEIITDIDVEVINSQDRTLIIGNDFLKEWKANIDFETHTMKLIKQGYEIFIPIEYIKHNKIRFETPPLDEEYDEEYQESCDENDEDNDLIYESEEELETPTYTIRDLLNDYDSEEDELK